MNQYAMNPFAGMTSGDQSGFARNPFLGGGENEDPIEGDYKLRLLRVATAQRKPLYVIETEILESNQPLRPAGMRCVSMIDLANVDLRGRNIAGFLSAVFGHDPTTLQKDSTVTPWDGQTWGEYAAWSVREDNPLAGREVGCRVQPIKTKAGGDFSLHVWVPMQLMTVPARARQQSFAAVPPPPQPPGAAPGGFATPGGFTPPGAAPQPPGAAPGGFVPPGGGVAPMPPQGQSFPQQVPQPQPGQQSPWGQPGGQWNGGKWGGPSGGGQPG
jgi:hypothetical protein